MNNYNMPSETGYFGRFGGTYVPEALSEVLNDLAREYDNIKDDEDFNRELNYYLKDYVGRESPLYFASRLTEHCGGAKIYLKREDLNHTGAHKINNAIGQALLAKRMGKTKILAETGAGQHGVATATACALLGLECMIFMGQEDARRQKLNVFRMKLLGAEVVEVTTGTRILKDAVDEALSYFVSNSESTAYIIGSAIGPHPYPTMVRNFQKVIGEEAKRQILEKEGRLPDKVMACIGGGSNAMGMFYDFIKEKDVELIAVEAAGEGVDTEKHAATLTKGKFGVLHGNAVIMVQDEFGEVKDVHSVSAGLDYPGVGPEPCYLSEIGRMIAAYATDDEAIEAFQLLCEIEGIIPALESSHAIAYAIKTAKAMKKDEILLVNLSGRGDKDVEQVLDILEKKEKAFN